MNDFCKNITILIFLLTSCINSLTNGSNLEIGNSNASSEESHDHVETQIGLTLVDFSALPDTQVASHRPQIGTAILTSYPVTIREIEMPNTATNFIKTFVKFDWKSRQIKTIANHCQREICEDILELTQMYICGRFTDAIDIKTPRQRPRRYHLSGD